jgi:hypothetical protein
MTRLEQDIARSRGRPTRINHPAFWQAAQALPDGYVYSLYAVLRLRYTDSGDAGYSYGDISRIILDDNRAAGGGRIGMSSNYARQLVQRAIHQLLHPRIARTWLED